MGLRELKIEITDKCLLKCTHCSTGALESHTSFLPKSTFKNIVDQAHELGCQKVFLSGGEPLLHPEINDFLKILQAKRIDSKVYSCGFTQLSPPSPIATEALKRLKTKGLRHFVFSLYSATAQKHDSITNIQGSFEATKQALENAISQSITTEIHFVATKKNIGELADLTRLSVKMGVHKISILRFVPQGRGKLSKQKLTPSIAEYKKLRSTIISLKKETSELSFRLGSPFNFLLIDAPTPCTTGSDKMIIDVDGFAYPCDALKQVNWGNGSSNNAFEYSLSQVMKDAPLFQLVKKETTPKTCKKCPNLKKCQGGCLAQRLLKGGDLSETVDPSCLKSTARE